MYINLPDVTICMHLRIDSAVRLENVLIVLNYIIKITDAKIMIIEADSIQRGGVLSEYKNVSYVFIQDSDPVFHLTGYRNELIRRAITPIVALWDVDMIVPQHQLIEAVEQIRQKKAVVAYPHDGIFFHVSREVAELFGTSADIEVLTSRKHDFRPMFGGLSTGRIFIADRKRYMEIGMENEYMRGWGPEDMERLKRMTILGLPVFRVRGDLYHLWHPRGNNYGHSDKQREIILLQEYLKICRCSREELLTYIKSWEWLRTEKKWNQPL